MMEFLETLDRIKIEEANIQTAFSGDGTGVRHSRLAERASYLKSLAAAATFIVEVKKGVRPAHHLVEALGTDDFPLLFGDVLDRQMLGAYREYPAQFTNYFISRTLRDFRQAKQFAINNADSVLDQVDEQEQYPGSQLDEVQYTLQVLKYGRRIPFSWESAVNDDLDALDDVPQRFGRAVRRTEAKLTSQQIWGASGPHPSFFTGGNGNIIASNPTLTTAALQKGFELLSTLTDANGEPIFVERVELVVGPALEVTAMNITQALQMELLERGGTTNTKLIVANWITNRIRVNIDPYLPIVAFTANGATSWALVATAAGGRPAFQFARLRGHEEPEIFLKEPNARRVGGGAVNPLDGDFDTDSFEYKVRAVFGAGQVDPKMAVASNGSGS